MLLAMRLRKVFLSAFRAHPLVARPLFLLRV
jgi:hypothetical protein